MGDHVDLDRLEALEKAATAGPWTVVDYGHGTVIVKSNHKSVCWRQSYGPAGKQARHDYELVAATRSALPALLRELREARAVASAASAYLQAADAAAERPATDAGLRVVLDARDALRAALAARESQGGGGG